MAGICLQLRVGASRGPATESNALATSVPHSAGTTPAGMVGDYPGRDCRTAGRSSTSCRADAASGKLFGDLRNFFYDTFVHCGANGGSAPEVM